MSSESPIHIRICEHPYLRIAAFTTRYPKPLAEIETPPGVLELLRPDATAPMQGDERLRLAVRDLLRHGGYRPSGRGKPASEYLIRAAGDGTLVPINLAVDVCNVVSLHSGFPIGVVDMEIARSPFRIAIAAAGSSYVFNPAGQEIALGGLLCLFDSEGPCVNPVRDSQRTKTRPETLETLSVVWSPAGYEERLQQAVAWYRGLLEGAGAATAQVPTRTESAS
jgi:DNA/RNA-binding domain of Phe-tRNA-synthetase-like protein